MASSEGDMGRVPDGFSKAIFEEGKAEQCNKHKGGHQNRGKQGDGITAWQGLHGHCN